MKTDRQLDRELFVAIKKHIELAGLTQKTLKLLYEYDEDTGVFTNKLTRDGVKQGTQAGSISDKGYWRINILGKLYRSNRLACLYITGEFPPDGYIADHDNQVKTDNRWSNLNIIPASENRRNLKLDKRNKTGFSGIKKKGAKWEASITVKREFIYLGVYDFLADAVVARKAAEVEHGFNPNHGKMDHPLQLYLM